MILSMQLFFVRSVALITDIYAGLVMVPIGALCVNRTWTPAWAVARYLLDALYKGTEACVDDVVKKVRRGDLEPSTSSHSQG